MKITLALLVLVGISIGCRTQPPITAPQPANSSGAAPRITVGADRLFAEFSHLITGKAVALVSNHSGVLANGTHLADSLHNHPGVRLKALFGMDYDIRSNDYSAARDADPTTDKATGIAKHSLYGEVHKPAREMLDGIDVVVFDIQEVGARFYEHINILGFVMEAAAEMDIDVVVLDRPNPITGVKVDGFLPDQSSLFTFGSYAPVPVVHGMTMGELAQLYNGEKLLRRGVTAKLHVIPMRGWSRSQWYDEIGIPWSKPSPNLLTLQSVLAYVGTCLFEAVNVSEGRGTDNPFEIIGAAWLDNVRARDLLVSLDLKGVSFDTATFTPVQKSYHGRPPELAGETLRGVRLRITDRDAFEPYKVGVAMLWTVNHLHPDKLVWNSAVLDRLTGTKRLKAALVAGCSEPSDELCYLAGADVDCQGLYFPGVGLPTRYDLLKDWIVVDHLDLEPGVERYCGELGVFFVRGDEDLFDFFGPGVAVVHAHSVNQEQLVPHGASALLVR